MDPQAGQDPTEVKDGQDPSATPQKGAANPNTTQDPKPQAGGKSIVSLEDALAVIKELRDEAAGTRKKNKDLSTRVDELVNASKTQEQKEAEELQRLRNLDSTWRQREAELNRKSAIALAVAEANSVDPKVLSLLLSQQELEADDNGTPTEASLSAAIAKMLTDKPYLFKQPVTDAPEPKAPPTGGAGTNIARKNSAALTRDTIDKMSFDEINRLFDSGEIPEALKMGALNKR